LYPVADVGRAKPQQSLDQAAQDGRTQDEGWRVRKDGSRFWAGVVIMALRDGGGKLRGFAALTRDITESKGTRDALADQSRVFQAVLASIAEGVIVADARGKFLVWNAAAEHMIGLGPADTPLDKWAGLYGCCLPDMKTPYPTERLPLVRALRGEAVNEEEMFLRNAKRPDGIWLSVNARPLHFEDGSVHGGVVVFRDITEHKRAIAH
jgi:PAS domain-containing protein